MQYQLIIDDDGDVLPAEDQALAVHMRSHRSGDDLQDVLIRKLGFLGIARTKRYIEIAFDHETVSPQALGGAIYWLSDCGFAATRITDPTDANIVTLFSTRGALVAHLSDLLSLRKAVSTVARMPIALEQSAFATRWRAAMAICTEIERPQTRNRLLEDLFQGYFSVLSRADGGDCPIEHLGGAYAALEPDFYANAVGLTFRNVYDKRIGAALADGYRAMASSRIEPSAESVRAMIKFPSKPPRRINYDRMVLPIGASHLLVANFAH